MTTNTTNRLEGKAKEMGGKIKRAVGKLIGNEQMEAEGAVSEISGKAKKESAMAAERAKGVIEEKTGAVKNRVGQLIDDDRMAAEGKAKEYQGQARQAVNRR